MKRAFLFVIALLSLLCVGFGPPSLTDSDIPKRRLQPQQLKVMSSVTQPKVSAAAAILVDANTRQILYAKNEHVHRAPASLVKMMTATVALKRGQLSKEIAVRGDDLGVYSAGGMVAGDKYTLYELLRFLLVPSDNASSLTIARGVAGDTKTFVSWMNEQAKAWGLADTHYANPHGLDDDGGYSTAYDLAIIALNAMQDPTFADIVRRPGDVIGGREVKSTNELLNTYSGTIGVKTGTEDLAGECFIGMVRRQDATLLVVVLGSDDRYGESRALLDYGFANYAELQVNLLQTDQNRYVDEAGTWHELYLKQPFVWLISPWQVGSTSLYRRIDDFSANADPNQPVGALEILLSGSTLTEVPIYAR